MHDRASEMPSYRKLARLSLRSLQSRLPRVLSRNSSTVLLVIVLVSEIGVGLFVIRDLFASEAAVQNMYDGSVRGLRRMGELQYQAQETRRSTLYALTTNDGNLQVRYADQSRAADRQVTEGIMRYLAQARRSREMEVGERLRDHWKAYLAVRDEVLGLILESGTNEAVELDLASGEPSFDRVREDLEQATRLYDQRASERLEAVAASSRRLTAKLISAFGLTLIFGSIAVWAIQRAQLRSEMRLAELQMEFVTSVSHELRTPIAAILLAGENVRDGLVREESELREQGLVITGQANQLMELVDQVLQFAATRKNRLLHTARPLSVLDVVDCALHNTRGLLQESGFSVDQRIPAGLPSVVGDLPALSLCLQNLIANAVKYSGSSRWIGVSAALDQAGPDPPQVRISVQDRGLGIPDQEMKHVFEPFYRSPSAVAAQIHGSGLGLSIAKRSVEDFGGRLSVVSQVGVGSTFTLHLPVLEVEVRQTDGSRASLGIQQ